MAIRQAFMAGVLLAAVAALPGCTRRSTGQPAVATFQYRVLAWKAGQTTEASRPAARYASVESALNAAGAEGWNLVSAVPQGRDSYALFLKRPAQAAEPATSVEAAAEKARKAGASPTEFGPSPEVLKRMSPPGYTPYGQPPKPGEVRPPYDSSR